MRCDAIWEVHRPERGDPTIFASLGPVTSYPRWLLAHFIYNSNNGAVLSTVRTILEPIAAK